MSDDWADFVAAVAAHSGERRESDEPPSAPARPVRDSDFTPEQREAMQRTDPADLARELCDLLDLGWLKNQLVTMPCDSCGTLHAYPAPGEEILH